MPSTHASKAMARKNSSSYVRAERISSRLSTVSGVATHELLEAEGLLSRKMR